MTEAILLVGGQGTRLRPLTITTPKPMLPVAGYPCTAHQVARAKEAGITRIVLGTSYRAEVFSDYFGDGSAHGIEMRYAVEDVPLGTGGAIRHAAAHLSCGPDDPVVIFNGDVLTGLDISGLIAAWQSANADVALYLTRVVDPRPYGLVPTDAQGRVTAFLEKPARREDIVTDQINAGCYVFRRSVIDRIATDRPVSVERETFPELLRSGAMVIGVVDDGYWLDLGTPQAFACGSADLVKGLAPSPLLAGRTGDFLVADGAHIGVGAELCGGTYVGPGATVGSGAHVCGSVLFAGADLGAEASVTDSIVGVDAKVGQRTRLHSAVVGDRAVLGSDNEFASGSRIWPGIELPDVAIRLSSDL